MQINNGLFKVYKEYNQHAVMRFIIGFGKYIMLFLFYVFVCLAVFFVLIAKGFDKLGVWADGYIADAKKSH